MNRPASPWLHRASPAALAVAALAACAALPTQAAHVIYANDKDVIGGLIQLKSTDLYVLQDTYTLTIAPTGQLIAPLVATGAAISLDGAVINNGAIRSGPGSELGGLTFRSVAMSGGTIEAFWLTLSAGASFTNNGTLTTGSYYYDKAGLTLTTSNSGYYSDYHGGLYSGPGNIVNTGQWISNGDISHAGTWTNSGTFVSAAPPGQSYPQQITLDKTDNAVLGRALVTNTGRGVMLIGSQTSLRNSSWFRNDNQIDLSGSWNSSPLSNNVPAETTDRGRFDNGGLLNILAGATFTQMSEMTNTGVVRVSGTLGTYGVMLNTGNITVSAGGAWNHSGAITIGAGGNVTLSGGSMVGDSIVTNDGGTINIGLGQHLTATSFSQSSGTLVVDGGLDTYGGDVSITGGWLQGGGEINSGNFIVGGGAGFAFFRPGHSPGTMTIRGNFVLADHGVLELEIGHDASGQFAWDQVTASSFQMQAGSTVRFVIDASLNPTELEALPGLSFLHCGTDGDPCGGADYGFTVDVAGYSGFQYSFDANGEFHLDSLGTSVTSVPEPQTHALLLAGLGAVGWLARRRGRSGARRNVVRQQGAEIVDGGLQPAFQVDVGRPVQHAAGE